MDNGSRTTSKAIVGTILFSLLAMVGLFVFLVATGTISTDMSISTNVNLVGTVPVDVVFYAVMGFFGWMVYVAFADIYDSKFVEKSVEEGAEQIDEIDK